MSVTGLTTLASSKIATSLSWFAKSGTSLADEFDPSKSDESF